MNKLFVEVDAQGRELGKERLRTKNLNRVFFPAECTVDELLSDPKYCEQNISDNYGLYANTVHEIDEKGRIVRSWHRFDLGYGKTEPISAR